MTRDRSRVSGLFAITRQTPANDAYYILLHLGLPGPAGKRINDRSSIIDRPNNAAQSCERFHLRPFDDVEVRRFERKLRWTLYTG